MRRLVLGCGTVGQTVIEELLEQPGSLRVVTDDSGRVTALRDESVSAVEADPTDPANYPEQADLVAVLDEDPTVNRTAAARARERYPDAFLLAYTGGDPGGDGSDSPGEDADTAVTTPPLETVADTVLDPVDVTVDRALAAAGGGVADRLHRLLRAIRDVEGRLIVVAHDNPDPDALASAVALAQLAERAGVPADAGYHGNISHQENQALVNLLDLPLRNLSDVDVLAEYDGVALVDHSRPGVNDSLPPDIRPVAVIDHHPPREPVDAEFIDLRVEAGATSTLLAEYFDGLDRNPGSTVATALLYGIRIDTHDFIREVSEADFVAAANLLPAVDTTVLKQVEAPSVSPEVFDVIGRAVREREIQGAALAACVGRISDRDALAQAAELLLGMEGITTTLVYGYRDDTVYASGRTRGNDIDLGETARDAFGQIGSAGGHADMAGAQLPLGILADVDEGSDEALTDVVRSLVADRFFEAINVSPPTSGFDPDSIEYQEE